MNQYFKKMKKILLSTACALFLISSFGQSLQKGNVVSHHIGTVKLSPDVTYDQWKGFMLSEWLPAINKEFEGDCKIYFIEGERGHYNGSFGMFWVFKSVEARDKYWPEFQKSSEASKGIFNKLHPLYQKFIELGELKVETSSGWVVN